MMEIGCNRQPEREALLAMEKLEEMETMKSNTMGNLEVALRPPRKRKKGCRRQDVKTREPEEPAGQQPGPGEIFF